MDKRSQPFHNWGRLTEPSQRGRERRSLEQLVISLVHDARTRAGSNRQLASAIEPYLERDFSLTSVSNWARGTREPTASALLAIALAERLSVDWYLERYLSQPDAPMARQAGATLEERMAALEAYVQESVRPLVENRRRRRSEQPQTNSLPSKRQSG